MDDYSEFPTTPTGWQERAWQEQERAWQEMQALSTEDPAPPPPRRRVDLTALVPGVIFAILAIVVLAGVDVPVALFRGGGILWGLLIGAGVLILIGELRKGRRR